MHNIEFTYHLNEIDKIAHTILQHLNSKTLLVNGSMGSGKTTLINALLKVMSCKDIASSPTYAIVNEYSIPNDKVFHFDFYRIESIDDAYNFGIEDYLNSKHWLFIEWSNRISPLISKDKNILEIKTISTNYRNLSLTILPKSYNY